MSTPKWFTVRHVLLPLAVITILLVSSISTFATPSSSPPSTSAANTVYLPLITNGNAPPPQGGSDDPWERLQKRQEDFLRQYSDASGQPRPDLFKQGLQHIKQMRIAAGVRSTSAPSGAGGVVGVQWTQIGPAPLRVDTSSTLFYSGEVTDIAIDPRNTTDQVIYIATNDGGIWKTTDAGTSWSPKTDQMPSLSMGAVALDPNNPSIVYAGTGNNFDGALLFFKGVGIYKSVDAGETWTVLNPINFSNPNGIFTGVGVNRIAVLPGSGVLLAATGSGLYRSINGGQTFGANAPLFNDGNPILNGFAFDLKVDTASATTVYVSVAGSGLFKSVDGGVTFGANSPQFNDGNPILTPTGAFGFIAFTQSTQPNNQTMYASVSTSTAYFSTYNGLYRSTNGGGTWTRIQSALPAGISCFCGYDLTAGVDPQNPGRLFLGFVQVARSTDSGMTFSNVSGPVHADNHAMTFSPPSHFGANPTTPIYVGTDGGIATSSNGGGAFSNLNNGLATLLMDGIDIGRGSAANNAFTYGGLQDNGDVVRRTGFPGLEWRLNTCCDGGRVAVDPSNPMRAYSALNGGYARTTDGGDTWPSPPGNGLPGTYRFAVDPNNGMIVYATSDAGDSGFNPGPRLFQSTDGGATFTSVITFPAAIRSIATVKIDSNTLWVGLDNGTLQHTSNALAGASSTWTPVTVNGAPANARVGGVAIDPTNTAQVVAVYEKFTGINPINRTKHVFRTTDNGVTWTDISGTDGGDVTQNLPDMPLHSVVIDPGTTPHTIIVSSDAAVMRSADLGATWQVLGIGLPTVDNTSLQIDTSVTPSLLRVGTYGRSTFELTAASGPLLAVNADLAFGNVGLNTSATRIVQLFNVGSADLHIASFVRVAGSADFQIISGPPTPVTLPPGEEIDYTVRFKPTTTGNLTATLQINSDDPFTPAFQLSASGTGVAPKIVVTGDLNFGTVARGTAATRNVIVQNTGGAPLVVSSVAFDFGSDPTFSVVGPAAPQTIAPGSAVTFIIRFAPPASSTSGTKTGTLRINSNDPTSPSVTLPATGTVGVPTLTVSSTALQFGRVAVDDRTNPNLSDQVLRISNQSSCAGCDVTLLSLPIGGPAASDFSLVSPPPLPATIAAGNSLDLIVRFNPSAGGIRNATLTVNSNDPGSPSVAVSLSGEGTLPALAASPSPLIFGPTVFDPVCSGVCGQTLTETISSLGQTELILDTLSVSGSPMFSAAAATLPPTRVLPSGSFNEAVTFYSSGGPARKVTGMLHIEDTLGPAPTAPPVTTDVPLCGESVGRGIRVLVYDPNGNIVPVVTRLKLQSYGLTIPVNIQESDLPLTTIDPPTSCQRTQFHYENQNLQATEIAGQRGSYYILTITVGSRKATVSFTLEVNEFRTIIATVQ